MLHHFIYPGIFYYADNEVKVLIPDLNLTTEGNSIEEAFLYAKDYLRAYCTYAMKYDMEITLPSKFEIIKQKEIKHTVLLLDAMIDDTKIKK